ncbi:L-piperidine-6-carboxylate dehydrogenase [Denitromonas iodatirespirans]|uniref:aldehyde dehydrogenase (NAD(+)) n=1 Tax=Denitromonas iodatirespirans TaxID=2795389 RepID=A0A944D7G1_DENI1|nr:aldehyde dehydrogenase family protein [Denitromonas iodatirespirans]MBT0961349.1 aldehyde dehydrogenase family protein [Denitromonas iodatirespirans]
MDAARIFDTLGMDRAALDGGDWPVSSPIDGAVIARLTLDDAAAVDAKIARSVEAFAQWRRVPAPRRGELVRRFGGLLRRHKATLGALITLEAGKIVAEGEGEVQEMIDICDFAVGLSRQLYGRTIASERPDHALRETWHPLGPVGVISAFNFPMAVWSWNAALAIVCGNSLLWKPSEKTPLCAIACQHLFEQAMADFDEAPEGLSQLLLGGREVGMTLADDVRVPLISATGSCAMGRQVGARVAQRFGKSILELGGNNAIIVAPSANLDLAVRAIVFGAVGTAGQRCTSTRRIFVHQSIYPAVVERLQQAYAALPIGDPREPSTLVGPLIDARALTQMEDALQAAREQGGKVVGGERVLADRWPGAYYVQPALVEGGGAIDNSVEETFAPVLYCFRYDALDEAIARHNAVPQGLSSAIFTTDVREAERFLAATGSDCGIANVNVGTSGAEIGGAFGGEKATGGGRESGSDAWRGYMRRQTATVNYSDELPLAQGVRFG